jgi:hypothetical protein
MKTRKLVLFCTVAALLMLPGCKPIYQKMIEGEWVVDRYYKNGDDLTFLFQAYQITFHADGDFTETLILTNTGTWEIIRKPGGKIGEFQLQLTDNGGVRTFDIKEIKKDTVDIYQDLGGGDSEEFFLERPPEA